jgi:hypothetical protein
MRYAAFSISHDILINSTVTGHNCGAAIDYWVIAIDTLIVGESSELKADGAWRPGSTASQPQPPPLPSALATQSAFASPDKRGGMRIPTAGRLLEERQDLLRRCRVLSSQSAHFEQMLDRLGQYSGQLPLKGVQIGKTPWPKSQQSSSALVCPTMLSQISSMRNGGKSWSKVTFCANPSRQLSHLARFSFGLRTWVGSGSVERI